MYTVLNNDTGKLAVQQIDSHPEAPQLFTNEVTAGVWCRSLDGDDWEVIELDGEFWSFDCFNQFAAGYYLLEGDDELSVEYVAPNSAQAELN